MRQAFAGMLWSKQLYNYDVAPLAGRRPDPAAPARDRGVTGRNSRWRNFEAFDIMSMPDKWEYPWFAAWDLGFHCVALAHVDPAFAKYQLLLLCREWFQHPNGALPAYEWDFGDVNPPVQAWAALEVFAIDGGRDLDFLSQVFDKLLVNFTWWVNLEDADGTNLFEGGFLGLDNIGPIDRSHLPVGGTLEQSDATGWMAFYALAMGSIAVDPQPARASARRPTWCSSSSSTSPPSARPWTTSGVWDEADGFYYDKLVHARRHRRCRSRSARWSASSRCWPRSSCDEDVLARARDGRQAASPSCSSDRARRLEQARRARACCAASRASASSCSASSASTTCAGSSPSCSTRTSSCRPTACGPCRPYHRDHPYELDVEGITRHHRLRAGRVDHGHVRRQLELARPDLVPAQLPASSSALERYYRFFGDDFTDRVPDRQRVTSCTLDEIADDLRRRLIVAVPASAPTDAGPCFGGVERLQTDPAWQDNLVFNEYFHGDNGAGLGASHQTGWTGLVADLIRGRPGNGVYTVGDVARHHRPARRRAA